MIYGVIEEWDERAIKIGYAQSEGELLDVNAAIRRVSSYQTGNPRDLYIVCGEAGDIKREGELHRLFSAHRLEGEWFDAGSDVMAWIECCRLRVPVRVRQTTRRARRPEPEHKQHQAMRVDVGHIADRMPGVRRFCLICAQQVSACGHHERYLKRIA